MKAKVVFFAVCIFAACQVNAASAIENSVTPGQQRASSAKQVADETCATSADTDLFSFRGVAVGMSEADLASLDLRHSAQEVLTQGEPTTVYWIELEPENLMAAGVDEDGCVFHIQSASPKVIVPGGGRVGMTLDALRSLYPEGFVSAMNTPEGRFVSFYTGIQNTGFGFEPELTEDPGSMTAIGMFADLEPVPAH